MPAAPAPRRRPLVLAPLDPDAFLAYLEDGRAEHGAMSVVELALWLRRPAAEVRREIVSCAAHHRRNQRLASMGIRYMRLRAPWAEREPGEEG